VRRAGLLIRSIDVKGALERVLGFPPSPARNLRRAIEVAALKLMVEAAETTA